MKRLMALVAALSVVATLEAVEAQFSYQGVLKSAENTPLTGPQEIELRLYNVATGGIALWGHTYRPQLDANGLFNVEVSDSTGTVIAGAQRQTLDAVFAQGETIYLGIKLRGSSGEISPRQKLLPVPYAAFASDVSRASGNFTVVGTLTASNAVFTGGLTAKSLTVEKSFKSGPVVTAGNATISGDLKVTGTISGMGTVPVGAIIMWSGSQVPTGWALCDGTKGTPNLRDRFIVGAGASYVVGDTGGANSVRLNENQLPSHSHNYSFKVAGASGILATWESDFYYAGSSSTSYSTTKTTAAAGGGQAHENRPPYYALAFIQRQF